MSSSPLSIFNRPRPLHLPITDLDIARSERDTHTKMSSLVDAVLNSDNTDLDLAAGAKYPDPSSQRDPPPSSRPFGPPSESNAPFSDAEGFADDEVVGARGTVPRHQDPRNRNVPKVVDAAGERVQQTFEDFLES